MPEPPTTTDNPLNQAMLTLNAASTLLSIWLMIWVTRHERKQQTVSFYIFQTINIFAQACRFFYSEIPAGNLYLTIGVYLGMVTATTIVYGIFLVDLDMLSVFSVLDPRLTKQRIQIARWTLGHGLFVLQMAHMTAQFVSPLSIFRTAGRVIFMGGICIWVIWDQIQTFYLAYLIRKASLKHKDIRKYRSLMWSAIGLTLLDWLAITLTILVFQTYSAANYEQKVWGLLFGSFSTAVAGFHLSGLVLVFHLLKSMSTGRIVPKAEVPPPTPVHDTQNEKTTIALEMKTIQELAQ
ncbi:hypothetical protein EDD86DRAFT_207320 [Gorgonomyces haynaldii]|nr:hypothetical protein EDD86DRAFT_207320 [Gorgonomyces haynaldii]